MRTFLAVEIPNKIRRKVDQLISEEKNKNLPMKWVKFENLHITLKFLGEIEESKIKEIISILEDTTKSYTGFDINLEGIGCFPHPDNPRVLWIGVKHGITMLTDIAREIEKNLGAAGFREDKRFHAHLTLARTRKFCKLDKILALPFTTENFSVNSVTLFESILKPEGPIYAALKKFNLSDRRT
jgi:2'-5' RNA ligase